MGYYNSICSSALDSVALVAAHVSTVRVVGQVFYYQCVNVIFKFD